MQNMPEAAQRSLFTDVVVVGGGPAGATCATDLARAGRAVVLLDRAGRIKPCGGAIPPKLIEEFAIPDALLVARVAGARIVAPSLRSVDMPIQKGFVGMVDRETFDEWLRARAANAGAVRVTGTFERIERVGRGLMRVHYLDAAGAHASMMAAAVVGADGARSKVAEQEIPAPAVPTVFAYHEIIATHAAPASYDAGRCDVVYDGATSPDFYGWLFPHGATASIGTGSAHKGFSQRQAVAALRARLGLTDAETVRREGAPLPMHPRARWDNGRDVVLAGDAAGCVAPASGEGIYYAMYTGRLAAEAMLESLETADPRVLAQARRRFMRAHGRVFWVLGMMQRFWYSNDARRERFVRICADHDVQRLTWEAYMNKRLVRAHPLAHARIFCKDLAHLLGLARV